MSLPNLALAAFTLIVTSIIGIFQNARRFRLGKYDLWEGRLARLLKQQREEEDWHPLLKEALANRLKRVRAVYAHCLQSPTRKEVLFGQKKWRRQLAVLEAIEEVSYQNYGRVWHEYVQSHADNGEEDDDDDEIA